MRIFVDVDEVVTKSILRFCEFINKESEYDKVKSWNFEEVCDLTSNEIEDIFSHINFYSSIKLYEGCVEAIDQLSKNNEIIFITKGTSSNNIGKLELLNKYFPNLPVITLSNDGTTGKEIINMENSILIDDHSNNLDSSNARYKILFEPYKHTMNYNKDYFGATAKDWKDVMAIVKILNRFYDGGMA